MTSDPNSNRATSAAADADAAAAVAAALLERHPDYLVLRRIGLTDALAMPTSLGAGTLKIGIAVDVETTGLNPSIDSVIELALQRFRFDRDGRIVEIGAVRSWREDPGFPLPPEIVRITGLTDHDLQGQTIDTDAATDLLRSADLVIAHNAAFDRKFVETRLPDAAGLPWTCSLVGVDWQSLGFQGRSLPALLMECGRFYPPHRAELDVAALLHLLAHECLSGDRVLARIVANAEHPTVRIDARNSPFEIKDALKTRGYRWDADQKNWWIEVGEDDVESEQLWLQRNGYLRTPTMTAITARERYL